MSDNVFKITLFSRNAGTELDDELTEQQSKILDYIKDNQAVKRKDIENLLVISQTMAG